MQRKSRARNVIVQAVVVLAVFALGSAGMDSRADGPTGDTKAGHSIHGMAFDEGPRQAAYLMEGMGNVDFPITTKDQTAQKFFNQGLAQIHGFWFYEAERSFRQAAKLDPDCVMAYWGMALANQMNDERFAEFTKEAKRRAESVELTEKEQEFIRRLGSHRGFEFFLEKYPDEIEALAFESIQAFVRKQYEMKKIRKRESERGDALLDKVFAQNPQHPAHHYRIHLWDQTYPHRALESAIQCPQTAPGIAHMWHMSGHLYSLLRRHIEADWYMEACVRVDHRHMLHDRLLPDQMHFYTHNAEWWLRTLLTTGRPGEAITRSKEMIELPRHPEFNYFGESSSSTYGRLRLMEALEKYGMWDEMIQLIDSPYLNADHSTDMRVAYNRHVGAALARTGDIGKAKERLKKLEEWLKIELERNKGIFAPPVKDAVNAVAAHIAVASLKSGESSQSNAGPIVFVLFWVVIGVIVWRYLRRRWIVLFGLLSLIVIPVVYNNRVVERNLSEVGAGHYVDDEIDAGHIEHAIKIARRYVVASPNEAEPLARLTWALWKGNKKDEAKETFEELRKFSKLELDVPVFERLTPLAAELGYGDDWRDKSVVPDSLKSVPALESLGPIRWKPWQADPWSLADADGKQHQLKDYRGKPVVVVFFLGYTCSHCVEQLYSFADQIKEFEDAGLEVIAISTDPMEKLNDAKKNYAGGEFPYEIVSGENLDVFKAYRCYDDFEEQPLHGTFLIDATGHVRWQDISYKPFTNVPFLIKESNRLLQFDYGNDETTVAEK